MGTLATLMGQPMKVAGDNGSGDGGDEVSGGSGDEGRDSSRLGAAVVEEDR